MFLLIGSIPLFIQFSFTCLNTSHVSINQYLKQFQECVRAGLNTSHVSINQRIERMSDENERSLNTSHVSINPHPNLVE